MFVKFAIPEDESGEVELPDQDDGIVPPLSKWEEGLGVIESLLEPGSDTFEAMTDEQRIGLINVKSLLTNGIQMEDHIPTELMRLRDETHDIDDMEEARYLLTEFGGVREMSAKQKVKKVVLANIFIRALNTPKFPFSRLSTVRNGTLANGGVDHDTYAPTEWKNLSQTVKETLYEQFLCWEKLSKWDFNIFQVSHLCGTKPLLFIGWALLGSPYSQIAMAKSIGYTIPQIDEIKESNNGYKFLKTFKISTKSLCDYLRIIESDYNNKNPYHNNIHAADVVQTLHSLIEMKKNTFTCADIELFSILLAAVIHDVSHPGFNNAYQINAKTELALLYNDLSVLESMHASKAFRRMFGGRTTGDHRGNILCNLTPQQVESIRKMTIEAVLHTDMSKHFSTVASIKGLIHNSTSTTVTRESLSAAKHESATIASAKRDSLTGSSIHSTTSRRDSAISSCDTDHISAAFSTKFDGIAASNVTIKADNSWKVLIYMLHLADVSNPAKPAPMFVQWTDRCLEEFFAQGDKEEELGLNLSPLCDRSNTSRPGSQIGFINFIVKPSFDVLAKVIPTMNETILPIIESNIKYWEDVKQKDAEEEEKKTDGNDGEVEQTEKKRDLAIQKISNRLKRSSTASQKSSKCSNASPSSVGE